MPLKHQSTKYYKKRFEPIPEELEFIAKQIVDAAYTVHKHLGPGLLEKVYEICFCHELKKRGLACKGKLTFQLFMTGLLLMKD
jgi:GxxExxY protein